MNANITKTVNADGSYTLTGPAIDKVAAETLKPVGNPHDYIDQVNAEQKRLWLQGVIDLAKAAKVKDDDGIHYAIGELREHMEMPGGEYSTAEALAAFDAGVPASRFAKDCYDRMACQPTRRSRRSRS